MSKLKAFARWLVPDARAGCRLGAHYVALLSFTVVVSRAFSRHDVASVVAGFLLMISSNAYGVLRTLELEDRS